MNKIITSTELLAKLFAITDLPWNLDDDLMSRCEDSLETLALIQKLEEAYCINIPLRTSMKVRYILELINK